jgi:hypothetical protein
MPITFTLARENDADQFRDVADGFFGAKLSAALLRSFPEDRNHHIVLARKGATVIGCVSAVSYLHPDKP